MHVLHLDAGRGMGGGQWQVLRLLEGLAAAGIGSTLQARPGSPLFQKAAASGFDVHPLGLRLAKSDLIHAHDARTHTLAAFLGRRPLIVSRRVAFPIRWRRKYRRASHYIAVSQCVKRELLRAGVPEPAVTVIHDGVPLLPDPQFPEFTLAVKRTDLALAAASLAKLPVRVSHDLAADLPRARLLLYLSDCEGLGSGILLAMSAGVPVIASKVGGIPEIIEHEYNGLLVENRPDAIADALRRLNDDPALARLIAVRARRRIQERFTVTTMVQETIWLYQRVLAC